MNDELICIKDKAKRLQYKRQIRMNELISMTIAQNTFNNKLTKTKIEKLTSLLKNDSLYQNLVTPSNQNVINKMPYLLFGVVESVFIDEDKSEKTKEYGCGILIDSSVVLIPSKNLIFDNSNFSTNENNTNSNEENTKEKYNFKLFEIEFKPLNISPEFRSYLPKAIKVIDHYTPLSDPNLKEANSEENNDEDEKEDNNNTDSDKIEIDKLLNGWGLAFLEYPIGDVLNYVYSTQSKTTSQSIIDDLYIKHLSNSELEQCEISFLECYPKMTSNTMTTNNSNNENNEENENVYDFHESYYDMTFDTRLIYLNNPYQEQQFEENVLPGFIVGSFMKKYYLLGMSTNTLVQFPAETNNTNENEIQNYLCHIAIRFNKSLSDIINAKVMEFNQRYPDEIGFNPRIFQAISSRVKSKNHLLSLLKNNCDGLYKLINEIKKDKKLSANDKRCLDIECGNNMKFIQFSIMLLYNKYTSSLIESQIIDMENFNIGYYPGSSILSEIIQSKESLTTLNLKNNELFSSGIKEIMLPIFNKKKILDIGKDLKCLCLDSNKLNGKSLKYIRYLIKVSPQLALLSLSNNNLTGTSLRHLINATKDKESMVILYLNSNLLGSNCGDNLNIILTNLVNLRELNLSCNCIGDTSLPLILNALKQNDKIETLLLGYNDITSASSSNIATFLSNNHSLRILWLNNNPLNPEGIKTISQSLSTKLVLEEINLNSTNAGDIGGKELFENMKLNKSLKRLFLNTNDIGKESMEKFGEMMKMDNEDENSEGGIEFISLSMNLIDDEGVKSFVEELMNYRWIKEIKFNSNHIGDEGGELLLYAALQNMSITKINLENNNTTWVVNNENFKSIRSDIQIFF